MLKTFLRTSVAALAVASFGFTALPAMADGVGDVFSTTMVNGANTAIKNALERQRLEKKKKEDALRQQQLGTQSLVDPGTVA